MLVGVISDTHGMLRDEAIAALADVEHILHVGDVGNIRILDRLRQIAIVTAIRGNIDRTGDCASLPETEMLPLGGALLYLIHSLSDLDITPSAAGVAAVISGHTHQPRIETRGGILYLNPGSAGPRRFNLPVTVAQIRIEHTQLTATIVPIL